MYGFTNEEIDEFAHPIFEQLAEQQIPIRLMVLALCKAIVLTGAEEDLDLACYMIDKLNEEYRESPVESNDDNNGTE